MATRRRARSAKPARSDRSKRAPRAHYPAPYRAGRIATPGEDILTDSVKGKVVWTERMCSGQTLDKDSAAAIDAVKAAVAKLKP